MEYEEKNVVKVIRKLKKNGAIKIIGNGFQSEKFEDKNSDDSLKIRKEANQLFGKKTHDARLHEEVWKLYTKSIALAPNNSEELAVGYANRSVLLLHLKKYKECLLDIDRALKTTESYALKVKLYCRQNQCHIGLQNGKEKASLKKANFWLSKINDDTEKNKLEGIIQKIKNISAVHVLDSAKNKKEYEISCDNNAVRMSYNEKYGKHLVADRDIHVGELIYIEKFHVTSIHNKKPYAYCSHCLAISWATIPCEQCAYHMYCSEKCRKEAWQKYHDIECVVKLEEYAREEHIQMGLRALIMGYKETGSIAKLRKLTNEIDMCTDLKKRGLDKDGKFSMTSFRSIYSLNFSKCAMKVEACAHLALDVLILLAQKTHILGKDFRYTNNIDLMNNQNAIFLASLLVRLSTVSSINAFQLVSGSETCSSKKVMEGCSISCCCSRGLSLSLFTSLINHSCDNNVERLYTIDGRVTYYAVQPIQKNAQIFSSYYVNFMRFRKPDRHDLLSKVFELSCDCVACKNGWITFQEQPRTPTPKELEIFSKHEKTFEKFVENRNHRFSTKTISNFMQDTELLLKSANGPTFVTMQFRLCLSALIMGRYFKKLIVPSECDNNLKK